MSSMFGELPSEILRTIVKHVPAEDINTLRLTNWSFCNAIDDRLWQELEISLDTSGLSVRNSVHSYKLNKYKPKNLADLLICLDRNAARLKTVDVRSVFSFSITDMAKLFSVLRSKGVNIKQLDLHVSTWNYQAIEQFKNSVPKVPVSSPFCTIELCPPMNESVVPMIEALCPYGNDYLEFSISADLPISSLPFSLFMTYGDAINSLKLNVPDDKGVARLISYLKFCTNLDTLHITMGAFMTASTSLPDDAIVSIPKSVRYFTFVPTFFVPPMTIIAHDIDTFDIDFTKYPSGIQLKFASLSVLSLTNCAKASSEQLSTIAQMGCWKTLRLDTMEFAQIIRFKPLIRKAIWQLDLVQSLSESFDYDFDYLNNYVEWLNDMQEAISHLGSIVLKLPLLTPEELKTFIVKNICAVAPNLERMFFRQDAKQSGGLAILTRQYPFLKPFSSEEPLCKLYYLDRACIDQLKKELPEATTKGERNAEA
ncbi:hypothetical protein TRVA0_079S00210 [Trichomonascus vanleenenianus]|uniref:uncharacterized protein n=1 Tax=Trichomonascus vanleenenianus TaxID=2268995 RepID=UPI003ECA78D9